MDEFNAKPSDMGGQIILMPSKQPHAMLKRLPILLLWATTLLLTEQDRGIWILAIKRVQMKPPCCGACKIITHEETKMIWDYLTSPDPEKRSGKYLEVWKEHEAKLLEEFKMVSPERYAAIYKRSNKP